jgi:hypothetical protein
MIDQSLFARRRASRLRFVGRLLVLVAVITTFGICPQVAFAKEKTVAILVEGVDAEIVRKAVVGAVPHGAAVADNTAFRSSLGEQNVRLPFGRALDGAARDKTLPRIRKAAAAAGIDGTLIAEVTRSRKGRHVHLLLVATSGASGDLEDDIALDAKPSKDDDEKVASSVGTALVDYRGSPEPEKASAQKEEPTPEPEGQPAPHPDAQPAADTGPKEERPHGVVGRDLVEVDLGAGALGRHFGYTTDATSSGNLRSYSVFPAFVVSVSGELYPLADSQGFLRDLGLIGSFSRSLFMRSNVDNGTTDTTATSYLGGLRWRTMPAGDGGLQLGISLSYVGQSFGFGSTVSSTAAASNAGYPSVSYEAIRPGVDVRVPIGKLAVLAQAGFRAVLSAGDVALRFRGATTTGFDVAGGAAFQFVTGWEARALLDYEGYFYSFGPSSNDLYRAKGALDQLYGGRIAIAAVF